MLSKVAACSRGSKPVVGAGFELLQVDGSWDLRVADFNLSIRAEEAEESPRCKEMLSIHPRWLVRVRNSWDMGVHSCSFGSGGLAA